MRKTSLFSIAAVVVCAFVVLVSCAPKKTASGAVMIKGADSFIAGEVTDTVGGCVSGVAVVALTGVLCAELLPAAS